jgi:hypothetical protein
MKNVITRPIVCRVCRYKQTIEEIDGAYRPLTCRCGEVLFYKEARKPKQRKLTQAVVADGRKVILFASEEYYQEQKSSILKGLHTKGTL